MKKIIVLKDKNFTTINNEFIFKKEMSLKAKGLLCHLLALPNDWELYVEEVIKWHKDGRGSIYSAFKELKQFGYVERITIREKGKIVAHEYIVYERPDVKKQHVEKPHVAKQHIEKKPLLNTDNTKDLKKLNTNKTKVYSFRDKVNEYAKEMEFLEVDEFVDYWTERSLGAKKCRWQKQTSFDIKRRMQRWKRNANEFNKKKDNSNGYPDYYDSKFEWSLRSDHARTNEYHKHLRELGWQSKFSPAAGTQWKKPKK